MFEIKLPSSTQLDDLLFNQKQIVNTLASDALVLGVYWDKTANHTLVRSDASVGLSANVGIDGQLVKNDFDSAPIYREIGEVKDALGNVFIRVPKFYIRKREGKNFKLLQISKTKYPGFYLPSIFWDFTGSTELDYYDHGKYKASLSADNKLESKPDAYALIKKNIVEFRNYARANNVNGLTGYQQLDIHAQDVLQTLFTVEFATLNSQSIMQGFSNGQYTSHKAIVAETAVNRIIVPNATADLYRVGQAISVGTSTGGNEVFYGRTITTIEVYDATNKAIVFDGVPVNIAIDNVLYNTAWKNGFSRDIAASSGSIVANDGKYPCAYRGIEDPFAGMWQFVDGININEYQTWVCKDASQYASNVFTTPYEKVGYVNINASGSYVTEMGFDSNYPFAQFPTKLSGSASTYYSDYHWSSAGQRIALVGGSWYNGSDCGLWYWNLGVSSSGVYSNFGGRLLKKAS